MFDFDFEPTDTDLAEMEDLSIDVEADAWVDEMLRGLSPADF